MKKADDIQIEGDHYLNMAVQPWDIIDTWPKEEALSFYRGNALKYIMRAGSKGPAKYDYLKALHYMQKIIELTESMN